MLVSAKEIPFLTCVSWKYCSCLPFLEQPKGKHSTRSSPVSWNMCCHRVRGWGRFLCVPYMIQSLPCFGKKVVAFEWCRLVTISFSWELPEGKSDTRNGITVSRKILLDCAQIVSIYILTFNGYAVSLSDNVILYTVELLQRLLKVSRCKGDKTSQS